MGNDMTDCKHVMIFGELAETGLAPVTKELIACGKALAGSLGEELLVLFAGRGVAERAAEVHAYGADKVYAVEDALLDRYTGDAWAIAVARVVDEVAPRVLLFGHTEVGSDLGPRVAFALGRDIATDCVALAVDGPTGRLLRTKPVYGGLAMAVLVSDGFPQMATVRPKSTNPADRTERAGGGVIKIDGRLEAVSDRVSVEERVVEETAGVKLEDAEIIVSGGRGMGGPEGFKALDEIGRFLHGAVGGSRVAVDNGWISTSQQIGLTGTIVAPRVYVAVAISGASQHMTGCARSQRIIAINKDPNAPIFKQAHFGVVGDWRSVLPAFMEKLKEMG
jgi:caffeyl-CoA reductase-Etf complex subunit CarE